MRIIKKYPNRRLYDTDTSQYITLDEIKHLVINHTPFKVMDVRTEENVTNYVLLQIINAEEESARTPLFTTALLQNIIRFYGNPLQKTMSQFLEKNFSLFTERQADFREYLGRLSEKNDPFTAMADWAKQNMESWQSAFVSSRSESTKSAHKQKKPKNRKS